MENQRIRITKMLLKDALTRLLYEKKLGKITVSELCDKAVINRSTFYKYYGSPMDVYEDMEQDFFNAALQMLTLDEDSRRTGISRFLEFLKTEWEKIYVIIVIDPDPGFIERVFNIPALQYFTQNNNDPEYSERQNEYMRIFEYNGGYAVIREWVAKGCKEEPEEIENLLLHVTDYRRNRN